MEDVEIVRIDELYKEHKPIPVESIDLIKKSIYKIKILGNLGICFGTGFFMRNNKTI